MTDYDIIIHKHRFAAWAAGRASSTKRCRLSVATVRQLIEKIELHIYAEAPEKLPSDFDTQHREWRETMIHHAEGLGYIDKMTHGITAKIINVYLKGLITCGGFGNHLNASLIHPPIDRLLLNELAKKNVGGYAKDWRDLQDKGWSNFDSKEYEQVIRLVKTASGDAPLWMVEAHWRGYQ